MDELVASGTDVGTAPVRTGFRFEESALATWMMLHVPNFSGPLSIRQFKGGQSNPTYRLTTPSRTYVLRRKPPGPLLKGAHAIDREARVMIALEKTGFPVPHVHALCTDDHVIGTPFYIMDMVEGRIFWDATVPDVGIAERAQIYDAMNETIARLHRVDYKAVGLEDFGRSGSFFARQIGRWSQQYLDDTVAGRDPNMDRLIEWLPRHIPDEDGEASIAHGDFRIDNMIFHATEPKVLAVLDWELSTIGHPAADFAYHAMMYHMPPHIVAGLAGAKITELGIPDEATYLARYCARMGRTSMRGYAFYIAFNFFRLAAIFHGIKGRLLRGNAVSGEASDRAKAFPELAEIAWRQATIAASAG